MPFTNWVLLEVAFLGFFTQSSVMLGACLGLYLPIPKKILAGVLAFAAGSLIASLAIELAYQGAQEMERHGENVHQAWFSIASGFAAGAVIYYLTSLFLESKGSALRYPSRFLEYALDRKRKETGGRLSQLAKANLLRHLPPEHIEPLVERIQERHVKPGEVVIRYGGPGDALYIIGAGTFEVQDEGGRVLGTLTDGQVFGEMALLNDGTRTATVLAKTAGTVLILSKDDFDNLCAADPFLDEKVRRLSHERAISNLRNAKLNPTVWIKAARESVDSVSRREEYRLMHEAKAGRGVGMAIVFGNILDTIPGSLVIGAKFADFDSLSATLIVGMFVGNFPEAAASAAMLRRAGFSDLSIFLLWSTVLIAGTVAAVAGKMFISGQASEAVMAQAVAGGAILALVTHAMIPEALHKGGSSIVLPAVAGFLLALYLAMLEAGMP
ncbi:MAG: cyclic nucleotide-binding domain-containing protein [Alphaproteobacteria bacterium]|nr:cyclic nucleotide-binding domain-containing protein [Alphaproteobacteria bacterium]